LKDILQVKQNYYVPDFIPPHHDHEMTSDNTSCENLYLITWSEEGSLTLNGKKIQIVPAWRWLVKGSEST